MKTIAYIIPYFGKFPKGFQLWLLSCKRNETVDWLLFTDDRTEYDYPPNVKVNYCTFQDIQKKVQKCFDFKIALDKPYKLCDFKAAYGEIFVDELVGYDYWGMCDIDLVWGNIREFLTAEILEQYDRIGNQGHSTLFKNNSIVNARYRTCIEGLLNYKQVYSDSKSFCFDESGLDAIYNALDIPYYQEVIFAHLRKYDSGFFLDLLPKELDYQNERQILTWDDGRVYRYFLENSKIIKEKYMYCHFWCRPITFRISKCFGDVKYLIYADVVTDKKFTISKKMIKRYGKPRSIIFLAKSIWFNRHKITIKKIIFNFKGMLKHLLKK